MFYKIRSDLFLVGQRKGRQSEKYKCVQRLTSKLVCLEIWES